MLFIYSSINFCLRAQSEILTSGETLITLSDTDFVSMKDDTKEKEIGPSSKAIKTEPGDPDVLPSVHEARCKESKLKPKLHFYLFRRMNQKRKL